MTLTEEDLAVLRRFSSPTIANAIEALGGRRGEGCTDGRIRCLFPELGTMVGYASTATIFSGQPAPSPRNVSRTAYWEYVRGSPAPKVAVVQDLSETPGGAYWGEVNANIHRALGCAGLITNGSVRDLEEVRALGFHFFAGSVEVSHGLAHLEDFNRPVKLFGVTVYPGDLIHADCHGAVVVPRSLARQVAEAAREVERREKPMIAVCQSPDFSIEALDGLIPPEY